MKPRVLQPIEKFQAVRPAIQRIQQERKLQKQKGPLHYVFDIDDTLIFDNGRSTPNVQVVKLLEEAKANGDLVHLITARGLSARSETVAELKRAGIKYDTLDLAPEAKRKDAFTISNQKREKREQQKPIFLTVGDQWGDLIELRAKDPAMSDDQFLETMDRLQNTEEFPWQILAVNDGVSYLGFKLMSS